MASFEMRAAVATRRHTSAARGSKRHAPPDTGGI
jgi:hypothetical protein